MCDEKQNLLIRKTKLNEYFATNVAMNGILSYFESQ